MSMRLVELFDTTGDWRWRDEFGTAGAAASIKIDNLDYDMTIEESDFSHIIRMLRRKTPDWLTMLDEEEPKPKLFEVEFTFEDRKGVSKADDAYGITGTGNQFKLFKTVMEIMHDFTRTHDVDWFHFSAGEASRRKLYDRMASKFGRTYFMVDGPLERHYVVQA